MRQLVTSFLSTTSSQDIFLHLWVLNFQTCPTALQLCPSVGLTMLHPRESVIWADMSWYASYASVAFECIGSEHTSSHLGLRWFRMMYCRCGLHELTFQIFPKDLNLYHLVSTWISLDSFVFVLRVPVLGGAQIIAFAGLIETTGFFQAASTTDGRGPREGQFAMKDSTETGEPGNYGVGFPNFLGKVEDPEARKSKLAAELANGRLAMMAIIGMFFQVRCWKALAVATPQKTAQTYAWFSNITHRIWLAWFTIDATTQQVTVTTRYSERVLYSRIFLAGSWEMLNNDQWCWIQFNTA